MTAWMDPTLGTARVEYAGQKLHDVQDRAVSASLIGQIAKEAPAGWWAVVPESNGRLHLRQFRRVLPPSEEQQRFACDLAVDLNVGANCGGMWVVAWEAGDMALHMIWRDKDGDVRTAYTCEDSWARIKQTPYTDLIEAAVLALKRAALDFLDDLELKPDQMAKVAQGERPAH